MHCRHLEQEKLHFHAQPEGWEQVLILSGVETLRAFHPKIVESLGAASWLKNSE
jgi:hypothetical protein